MSINKYAYKACDHYNENIPVSFEFDENGYPTMEMPSRLASTQRVVLKFNGKPIPADDPVWGWYLEKNPLSVFPNSYLLKLFRERKQVLEYFTVSYYAPQEDCHKCRTLGHVFELQVVNDGEIKKVLGATKLVQEIVVFIMTRLGSLKFFDWLGTPITELAGSKFEPTFTPARVEFEILQAIEKYKKIQQEQAALQRLTPGEMFETVVALKRRPEEEEPTMLLYELTIRNKAKEDLDIPVLIRFS